ncbi:MAG: SIS domain-containing protein [Desulfohalobiaceae bacterium]|nr:SIS domain-containing protein [Desulfohalobiaceae bacterium]
MCGIVVYFGDAGNKLNRILTGMWAIIYRAPDSTGLGVFGDEQESIKTRKAVGSVLDFLEVLNDFPLYPGEDTNLLHLQLSGGSDQASLLKVQQNLLDFEGLSPGQFQGSNHGGTGFVSWPQMLDKALNIAVQPGQAGSAQSRTSLLIRSAEEFSAAVDSLVNDYDLPPLAVRNIFRKSLEHHLEQEDPDSEQVVEAKDILDEFEVLFESVSEHEKTPRPMRLNYGWGGRDPFARKYLRQYLTKAEIRITPDLDQDGIRNLFRLLDGAALTRSRQDQGLNQEIREIFHNYWTTRGPDRPGLNWETLYRAERAANVYGLAAASVFTWLQREAYLPAVGGSRRKDSRLPPGHVPGVTHPYCLRYLNQPIMAHGRWALQSEVNLKNTHPFTDEAGQRCVAVNGQFSGAVESRLRTYLTRVAGVRLESSNSTEYLVQFWSHYFDTFLEEQNKNRIIRNQVLLSLDDLAVGSQAVDYAVNHKLQGKTRSELDEMAFIQALQVMSREGGQVAAVGMNCRFPNLLYVGAHNRPVFIVQRLDSAEYMVVSDINAALGLFPQALIQEKARELRRLKASAARRSRDLEAGHESGMQKQALQAAEESILNTFRVRVYPLEGEKLFARIQTTVGEQGVMRELSIMNFEREPVWELEPFLTRLSPIQIKKDRDKTFYETHLQEIPERLAFLLETHVPENSGQGLPEFNLNTRLLFRRYGRDLSKLRRVFLIGIGASYNMAAIAKNFFQELLPEVTVVVLSPVEIDEPEKAFNNDHDLVILLSWSGTTADMVRLARMLIQNRTVCLGITEKPFADLGLAVAKSGGIIPVYSGEEVTIAAVKSSVCLLFCLDLLALSLAGRLGYGDQAREVLAKMTRLPGILEDLLADQETREFCRRFAGQYPRSRCHAIIDDVHTSGTGPEIAMKLEENSWRSMGKTFDYRDVSLNLFRTWPRENPVLLNITNRSRSGEAWQVARELHELDVPCLIAASDLEGCPLGPDQEADRWIRLPRADDLLQPFVDLVFYYQLGFYFGLAHGREAGDFPRNRAKSVTVTRGGFEKQPTVFQEIQRLAEKNRSWSPAWERMDPVDRLQKVSFWEQSSRKEWEKEFYRDLRQLGLILAGDDPLNTLISDLPDDFSGLADLVLKQLPVDGEIVLIPLDKGAEATARHTAKQWTPFLGCPIRVDSPGKKIPVFPEDTLAIVLASSEPEGPVLSNLLSKAPLQFLWFGPPIQPEFAREFSGSLGCYQLRTDRIASEQLQLYAALSLFLIRIWEALDPRKARVLKEHFQLAGLIISTLLSAEELYRSVQETTASNQDYRTGLFIGPASGNGVAWVSRFDHHGSRVMEWYQFGACAHGPVVTVDDRVENKFVCLEKRSFLVSDYGEQTVKAWEEKYLQGRDVDRFLQEPTLPEEQEIVSPFFARGSWYLPELSKDYDPGNDNLIVLDAGSERFLGQALDELSAFGCRYPRLAIISQESFLEKGSLASIRHLPVSHLLLLPDPVPEKGGEPISDFLLPFAISSLGVAMAAWGE